MAQALKKNLTAIFLLFLILNIVGLLVLYSASILSALNLYQNPYFFIKRQIIYLFTIALPGAFILSRLDQKILEKLSWLILGVNFIALILVLTPYFSSGNFKRWLVINGFSIQPAEFYKFSFLLFFSYYLRKINFRRFLFFILFTLVSLLLILAEKSYSNSLIFFGIAFSLFLCLPFNPKRFIIVFTPFLIILLIGAILAPYRIERIKTFLEKNIIQKETSTGFWQIDQARNAILSGGFWGKGFGQGKIKAFLPQSYNDTIFAVLGEELGFLGIIFVLTMFYLLIRKLIILTFLAKNETLKFFSAGLASWLLIQIAIHLSTVTGILPPTGVNFPFFSYGGSSLISLWWSFGVLFGFFKKSFKI